MPWRSLLAFFLFLAPFSQAATVLVLQFHNNSKFPDVNWVGESVAETIRVELSASGEIVMGRDSRAEAFRRLGLKPDADFTKATLIRLGQTLDVDYLCYGNFDIVLKEGEGQQQLRDSSVQISAKFLDLRKLRDGPQLAEAGKLSELSRLNEHLAWQALRYTSPNLNPPLDQFMNPQKFVRLDAEESYVRGLLASRGEQQEKWFTQAMLLSPKFAGPAFELGQLNLEKKAYRQALDWFGRVPQQDPRYAAARFRMGLAAYGSGDYTGSANFFREVAKTAPLNEVFNNLGVAENRLGQPSAVDDLRKAIDGDNNDAIYQFNLGVALLRAKSFDEATRCLQFAVDRDSRDDEARDLLERSKRHETISTNSKQVPGRLKQNFDETAFRQLKAMLQPKN